MHRCAGRRCRREMVMFRENQVIFMCALLVVAALPMIMLRDLISNTELNYLAVAIDANAHHRLFTFYEDGRPFTELPPLYLLLCRLSRVFGHYGVTCLLALNLACMVGIMYFCDRSYAPMLRGTGPRQKAIVALTASPFIVIMVILVQPEMISLLILTVLIYLLIRRTETLLLHPEREVTTGNVAIPVLLCTEVMTNGLYVILIVPLSVLFVLLVKRRLSLFLRILPPAYAMWFGLFLVFMYALILAEGGWEYCTAVLTKPLERLSYEAWHPLNIMKTIGMVVLLSLPMGICSVYTSIRIMRRNGRQTEVRTLYSILTPLACLIIFVLPGTKVYLFILYALPTLHYQMMYYLQMRHVGNRDLGVKICLMLGLVPFVTVLVLYYALRQRFPVMLDNNIEICALVLLTLVACKAAYKVYTSSAVNALCNVGRLFIKRN